MFSHIKTGFAAGTVVHTQEGLRPIDEIKVGDSVLTWPEDSCIPKRVRAPYRLEAEYIYKRVTKTVMHADQMITQVFVLSTGNNDNDVLGAAPNQSIFSDDCGWVPALELKFGDRLVWADFANTLVRKTRHEVERVAIYNFELVECHTYFVGKWGVWAHALSAIT